MNELENYRYEIDEIDNEMAQLFERRMKVSEKIAEYKKAHALPILDKTRESKVLANHAPLVKNDSYREYYMEFVKNVMKVSRDYQSRIIDGLKVVYSGTEGAFGHIAAKKMFPDANLYMCPDFADAYAGVERGEYDCAVLPLENSYAGDVGAIMDLMFSGDLYINQVIELEVEHNLLAKPGVTLDKIKTVVSHPQALDQCENFIKEHGLKTIPYSNTALAAKYVMEQDDESVAAIASAETAQVFGLDILREGINSAKSNTTRFAVFSRARHTPCLADTNGNEHFILVFTVKNEAGALAQILNIIGSHNFNMRNLRSRPMKELLWNYYFYIEAEGNIASSDGQDMLRELSAVSARLKLVGTYN